MANSISASFEEIWAREQQEQFLKKSVAMIMADVSFKTALKSWDVLQRTYRSVDADDVPDVYTRGSDMVVRDVTDTAETLTVNGQFSIAISVDDFDQIQSKYDIAKNYGEDYGIIMQSQIDADVLWEVTNASSTVDAGDVGGTSWQGIALTTSNVLNVLTSSTKKMKSLNVFYENKFGAVSPEFQEIVELYYGAKATDLWDKVSQNWYFNRIGGYDLYSTNNLTGTAVLALATQPTADDTVTIQGVTFTFVASPSAAWDIDIGSDVDVTRANLATLINDPATTTAWGVALTGNDLKKFKIRASAVNDNAANTLTVTFKGAGVLSVSSSLTDGTDTWTATSQKQLNVFGIKNKATTLVVQKMPSVEKTRIPLQFGHYIKNGMLYGYKTFRDNAKCMVKAEIKSSWF